MAEGGVPKALGAGLLSSAGELHGIERADIRPFDIEAIEATPYGTDDLQPTLFVADSVAALIESTLSALA